LATGKANRRLSDKVKEAVEHALAHGRERIARRLELLHQAIVEEDEAYSDNRRRKE
jgi:hypothetical protein